MGKSSVGVSMIAEAAYYRAERRGFEGGDPVQDWLAAEAEVDEQLSYAARQAGYPTAGTGSRKASSNQT